VDADLDAPEAGMTLSPIKSLAARDLHVRIGQRDILDGVSIDFAPAQVTAIIGPNGAGKSTLLNCLAGLRRPDRGSVVLQGADLARMPHRERARRMAFLPQTPEINWAVDVRTFVGLGRTPHMGAFGLGFEDQAAVEEALAVTGIEALAERVITTLSGGERARALIARALAGWADWLLADEPLTGLDLGHALDAVDLFRRLADQDGKGVVLTLHDLPLAARVADRVIVLGEGRILADGPPLQALSPEVLAKAYGVKVRLIEGESGPVIDVVGRVG
jgi:iron complex transport system ATP-binding protein